MRTVEVKRGTLWGRNGMTKLGSIEVLNYTIYPYPNDDTGLPLAGLRIDFYSPARKGEGSTANITLDSTSARDLAHAIVEALEDQKREEEHDA